MSTSAKSNSITFNILWAIFLLLFQSNAWACVKDSDSIEIPRYFYALIISIIFALIIIGITYLIKRLFFKTTKVYSIGIIAVLAFAFIIGVVGSFILPLYQDVYIEMGIELPEHTALMLKYKHLLWFPFLISVLAFLQIKSKEINLSWVLSFIGSEIVILTMVFWSLYSAIFVLGGC